MGITCFNAGQNKLNDFPLSYYRKLAETTIKLYLLMSKNNSDHLIRLGDKFNLVRLVFMIRQHSPFDSQIEFAKIFEDCYGTVKKKVLLYRTTSHVLSKTFCENKIIINDVGLRRKTPSKFLYMTTPAHISCKIIYQTN